MGDWDFKTLSVSPHITLFRPQSPHPVLPTAAHFSSSLTTTLKNFSKPTRLFRKIKYPFMKNSE
jgi:hypothetical protein